MTDNTKIHPVSKNRAHLIDLFLFKGAPQNHSTARSVAVLVNQGYIAGYSPECYQPLWSAYRVAHADKDIDYDRPHLYYADERLDSSVRLSNRTFGKKNGIQYHVGHMVPNEAINRQFGRLAQLETFFMSNMSPQRATLNNGVWLDLERKILNIEDTPQKDHMWVIAGPVFDADPEFIARDGVEVPIPSHYFNITVDPFQYPWDRESNVDVACFLFPQSAPKGSLLTDYITDLSTIQSMTELSFFPGWDSQLPFDASVDPQNNFGPERRHRLLRQLS